MVKPCLTLHFDIPITTLNDYVDAERSSRYKAAKIKQATTHKIALLTMSQTRERLTGLYDLIWTWNRKNSNHDPDNVFFSKKFILDGIVSAKVLPTDSRKNLRHSQDWIFTTGKESVVVSFVKVK